MADEVTPAVPVGSPVEQELGLAPERAAFEAWATDQGLALNRHRHSYAATATAWCWDAWQGGRAAERERCEARFHAALAAGRDVLDRQVREGVRAYVEQTIRSEWIRGA